LYMPLRKTFIQFVGSKPILIDAKANDIEVRGCPCHRFGEQFRTHEGRNAIYCTFNKFSRFCRVHVGSRTNDESAATRLAPNDPLPCQQFYGAGNGPHCNAKLTGDPAMRR
jgi:hypothetical protein